MFEDRKYPQLLLLHIPDLLLFGNTAKVAMNHWVVEETSNVAQAASVSSETA
jgi:hypothetical protein